jgi:FkbM family methyltransferase
MDIFEYIKKIIKDKSEVLVFEFGVCDAYHSNLIMNLIEEQNIKYKYYVFEPVRSLFKQVSENNKRENFYCINKAIGDKDALVKFYESGGQKVVDGNTTEHYYGSSSINKPKDVLKYWQEMTFEEKEIESIKFDTFIKENELQNKIIDFVWADIQGAEVKLIKGGKNTFKNVRYFYTEYSLGNLYQGDAGLKGILKALPNFEIEYDYQGDVLLRNKEL